MEISFLKQFEGQLRRLLRTSRRERKPARDWSVLLSITLVLTLLGSAVSVWMYLRVETGDFREGSEAPTLAYTVDRAKLSEALSKWKARETLYQEALVIQPALVDPKK